MGNFILAICITSFVGSLMLLLFTLGLTSRKESFRFLWGFFVLFLIGVFTCVLYNTQPQSNIEELTHVE